MKFRLEAMPQFLFCTLAWHLHSETTAWSVQCSSLRNPSGLCSDFQQMIKEPDCSLHSGHCLVVRFHFFPINIWFIRYVSY